MINIVEVKRQLRIVSKLFKSLTYNGYAEYIHYNSTKNKDYVLRVSIQFNEGSIYEKYTLYNTGTNNNGYDIIDSYTSIDELKELNKKERKKNEQN